MFYVKRVQIRGRTRVAFDNNLIVFIAEVVIDLYNSSELRQFLLLLCKSGCGTKRQVFDNVVITILARRLLMYRSSCVLMDCLTAANSNHEP